MGKIQSDLKDNSRAITITTSLMVIGGFYCYLHYFKSAQNVNIEDKNQYEEDLKIVLKPAEFKHRQTAYSKERLQRRQEEGDNRHKVVTNSPLGQSLIMQCIGRIIICKKDISKISIAEAATGTVFKVMNGYFLVITCAHSFLYKDLDTHTIKPQTHVYFERIETFKGKRNEPKTIKRYKLWSGRNEPFSVLKDGNNYKYKASDYDSNDLAVVAFEDTDGYYKNIFEQNQQRRKSVRLLSANKIPKNVILTYHIYGYPCGVDKYAKEKGVKEGELWGMRSNSYSIIEKQSKDKTACKYVQRNEAYFHYNAIDTEGGQSGSGIYLCLANGTYAIVGIHTNGYDDRNVGLALTQDKIQELLKPWK